MKRTWKNHRLRKRIERRTQILGEMHSHQTKFVRRAYRQLIRLYSIPTIEWRMGVYGWQLRHLTEELAQIPKGRNPPPMSKIHIEVEIPF